MERKDEQQQPDKEQPAMPQDKERDRDMARQDEDDKRKSEEERDNTVGKVPDPQGEDEQRDRSKT